MFPAHLHRRSSLALALAGLAALAIAGPAAAAPGELPLSTAFAGTMTPAAGTTSQACQAAYRPGTPGVATRAVAVPAGVGLVDVAMDGSGGDADLAVFDASDQAIAAGASPDSQEVAQGWTRTGGTLRVQICRRDGDVGAVRVVLRRAALPTGVTAAEARANPPQLVSVKAPTQLERSRIAGLGFDLTEHAGSESVGLILHDAEDRARAARFGLDYEVVVPDLVAQDLAARAAETRAARRPARAGLPSGNRTTYRTLADYESELKALADANPGLVKLITLPNKTWGGRDVMGVEIASDVNVADGRPGFFNMGIHHAREWPAGEHAMEWAYELVNGVKAGDARIRKIVQGSRNFVVPIINPDGFNASRTAGALVADSGRNETVPDTAYLALGATTGGEYRRKNCRSPDNSETAQCATSGGVAEPGVDPNRNYGGLWGGPGATGDFFAQTYFGPGPFSEPETRNVKALVGSRPIMSLITNHTTAGLLLRAPGIAALGDPIDENRGYKALGDDMALHNGYFSQKSFELYDTAGTTEDWTYNTAGGFGFTFEVYCGDPNYETGDCDDPAFHPSYQRVVEEYDGTSPQANHVGDPGPGADTPFGTRPNFDGQGNREAYKIAAESAMNTARHSVLTGTAAPGTTLRLKKTFKTETFPGVTPQSFDDSLEFTLPVGESGGFTWAVNPSTRPIVAKARGDKSGGTPSPPYTSTGGVAGSSETKDNPDDGAAVQAPGMGVPAGTTSYNDHPFTVPNNPAGNRSATVNITWPSPSGDWDMTLYEDENNDGKSQTTEKQVGTSATGPTNEETVNITGATLDRRKNYVLRVTNFLASAADDYDLTVTFAGPEPFQPAQVEAYTLTCERAGQVLDTQQVVIDRGEAKALTLANGCAAPRATPGTPLTPSPTTPGPTTPGAAGSGSPSTTKTCRTGAGFRSVGVKRRGRGLRVSFARKISDKAQVSIFQQSVGRRVTGERLVARYSGRTKAFTWKGKANRKGRTVRDGYFVVRFSIGKGATRDVRRLVVERRRGRFVARADYYRRGTCDALPTFKLERPVFGGRTNRALNVAFRLARASRVTVTVLRGSRTVKRFGPTQRRAGITHRLRLAAKGLPRGSYRVRISVRRAGKTLNTTLTARRL